MKRLLTLLGALALLAPPLTAHAVGTAAGTSISNQATASYDVSGTSATSNSNTDTITVDELIDVTTVSQNASNVAVNSPSVDRVLTFEITNTGNGVEDFELTATNRTGDQFDASNLEIYIDSNGNGDFDSGTDTLFTGGSGGDTLNLDANDAPNDAQIVFVVADIPSSLNDGDLSDIQLEAVSLTARVNGLTSQGDVAAGQGDGGSDAVVNANAGRDSEEGTFVISTVSVNLTKSSGVDNSIQSDEPNDDPIPGATITYTITVEVTGSGTAGNLVVEDNIPANTTYVPGSMTVDTGGGAVAQVDSGGGDIGEFDGGNEKVVFDFGDVDGDPVKNYTLTFEVTID